jgi:hypothetical protein
MGAYKNWNTQIKRISLFLNSILAHFQSKFPKSEINKKLMYIYYKIEGAEEV